MTLDPDERRDADEQTEPVSVTVYSREHCHLCEEAIEALERAADETGVAVAIEEVDVDEDPDLHEEYGERVPYVLVNGRPAFKFRVDEAEARERLRAAAT
jgi:thiol-disulfide isomerase/thioredoxin